MEEDDKKDSAADTTIHDATYHSLRRLATYGPHPQDSLPVGGESSCGNQAQQLRQPLHYHSASEVRGAKGKGKTSILPPSGRRGRWVHTMWEGRSGSVWEEEQERPTAPRKDKGKTDRTEHYLTGLQAEEAEDAMLATLGERTVAQSLTQIRQIDAGQS